VIDGHAMQLRTVNESWREALFGSTYRFYRGWPVPMRQLVRPAAPVEPARLSRWRRG